MTYKVILILFLAAIISFCKKEDHVINRDDPFYANSSIDCNITKRDNYFPCIKKKEDLACYTVFKKVESLQIDQVFRDTKWTSPDIESTFNYYFDKQNKVRVFEGGPSRNAEDFVNIGEGRIYQKNKNWIYEHHCIEDKCPELKLSIEYVNCSVNFSENNNEHRLFLTIGNRFYDNFDSPEKRKSLSIVLEDPVKPQIENGFELYLVPPDSK